MDLIKVVDNKHKELLQSIRSDYPIIEKSTKNFNKTQSQFMDNCLTLHQLTPLRTARQCLAEIKKSQLAMEEAYFKIRKLEITIEKGERMKAESHDDLSIKYFDIEIQEAQNQIKNINDNICGAIRRIANYVTQYKNILKHYGKEYFTEEDFEKEEDEYHIKTAFSQALTAALAHGGIIDEGNHIYFFQIGISGVAAQIEIKRFLESEDSLVQQDKLPPHENILFWLDEMAEKYSGSALKYAGYRCVNLVDKQSLLSE